MIKGRDGKADERFDACWAPCRDRNNNPLPILGDLDENGLEIDDPKLCSRCPKGTAERQRSLSPENWQCYEHYLECKAVSSFPDDPVVRRNAVEIRRIEEANEQCRQGEFYSLLTMLAIRRGAASG